MQLAKAENRNARLAMDKEQLEGSVDEMNKSLEQQRRDAQHLQRRVEQLTQQCHHNDKLLVRMEHQLVRSRTLIQELNITLRVSAPVWS